MYIKRYSKVENSANSKLQRQNKKSNKEFRIDDKMMTSIPHADRQM